MLSILGTMKRRRWGWITAILTLFLLGCGQSDPGPREDASEPTSEDDNAVEHDNASPSDDAAMAAIVDGEVTWHEHMAPLIRERCVGCHRGEGIAPFALETYEQASELAGLLAVAVRETTMPPWGALETEECEPRHGFKDDLRLSDEQKQLFEVWADNGAPEGEPDEAQPLPAPPELRLENPDLNLAMDAEVSVSGTQDQFLCFSLDPQLAEDAWISALQVNPGNSAIVHHVLLFTDPRGESAELAAEQGHYDCFGGPGIDDANLIGAWAPGSVPLRLPDKMATPISQGSRIVMNVHYHPTGAGEEVDSETSVDLQWYDGTPERAGSIVLVGNFEGPNNFGGLLPGPADTGEPEFRIPAGASDHTETMTFEIPGGLPNLRIWAVGTHMHYVGRDMLIELSRHSKRPGQPDEECLIQTPKWDFNWQRGYIYDAPFEDLPDAASGDVITFRCTYDNSMDNPFVREALAEQGLDAPRDVTLGEESLDEMCLAIFGVAAPLAELEASENGDVVSGN